MMQEVKNNTILIVDDEQANIRILSDLLRTHYTLRVAITGEKAIQIAMADRSIDLVLLDIMMPGINGYEVCEILKTSPVTKDIPVIFLTAKSLPEDEQKGFEAGAVDYITKPISPAIVLARVNTHIRLRNVSNSLKDNLSKLKIANDDLDAFSASVAHDLRGPLQAIVGFSQLAEIKYKSGNEEDGMRYLQNINANVKKMGGLINDLLTFSRMKLQEMEKQLVDPGSLADLAFKELYSMESGRQVKFINSPQPPCQADPNLLKIVFVNLISNALKFTRGVENPCIEVGHINDSNCETICFVRDNGVGFDMRYVDKVFGVFQRLHKATDYEGTGIGMSIVQRIIERHGGSIWAESEINKGTTFFFTMG
jgi:two-component system, sensor histidine kinase and response regulator